MELDFDKTFNIITTALKMSRSHPYIARDWKWAIQFLILQGIFTLASVNIFFNIIYHDIKINDFPKACKDAILLVVYSVITLQYVILLCHQDSIAELIRDMKKDYAQCNELSTAERDVLYKYANQGVWVSKQWLVIALNGPGLFIGKSVIMMLYYYCIGETQFVAIHDMVYPAIIENNKDNIYVCALTFGLMAHFAVYSCTMYIAYVPLGPILMLHMCGQLDVVQSEINDLYTEFDDIILKRKLKKIIVRLQYIYSFVDRINRTFKIAYEFTLKGTTLMLPITLYEVLEAFNHGEISLEFITFLVGGTLISSSPCYYSDLLMEKGEKVRLSLYMCGWEQFYDRRTCTSLQLMLQHALRPIAIQTIFRALCLDALTDLFQQSYAIFNLMNAMWS